MCHYASDMSALWMLVLTSGSICIILRNKFIVLAINILHSHLQTGLSNCLAVFHPAAKVETILSTVEKDILSSHHLGIK